MLSDVIGCFQMLPNYFKCNRMISSSFIIVFAGIQLSSGTASSCLTTVHFLSTTLSRLLLSEQPWNSWGSLSCSCTPWGWCLLALWRRFPQSEVQICTNFPLASTMAGCCSFLPSLWLMRLFALSSLHLDCSISSWSTLSTGTCHLNFI